MAAHCLKRAIEVYQPDPLQQGRLHMISRYGEDDYTKQPPITLLYNGHTHYDVMIFASHEGNAHSKL